MTHTLQPSYAAETAEKYRVGWLLGSASGAGVGLVALQPYKNCNPMGVLFAKWVFAGYL